MTSPFGTNTVPVVNLDGCDENAWASSSSSTRHHNLTPSVTSMPPGIARSSNTLHRRRTSENASTSGRTNTPWAIQHSRTESSDSVRGHPLRRDSGGPSAFNDLTVTRPILNLRLSPSPIVDVDENASEAVHEVKTDSGEKEELVLVHEVGFFSLGVRRSPSAKGSNWYSRLLQQTRFRECR
jgi:hypothetical protein